MAVDLVDVGAGLVGVVFFVGFLEHGVQFIKGGIGPGGRYFDADVRVKEEAFLDFVEELHAGLF